MEEEDYSACSYLVLPGPVVDGVAVPGVRRDGARLAALRASALLLHPRRAVRVDLAAHGEGPARRQVRVRRLQPQERSHQSFATSVVARAQAATFRYGSSLAGHRSQGKL
jgi:hypothetical protein